MLTPFSTLLCTHRRAVALIVTVVAVGALVSIPIFVTHSNVEAQSPCAPYISYSEAAGTGFGRLRGSRRVSISTTVTTNVGGNAGGVSVSTTTTTAFNVGIYDMEYVGDKNSDQIYVRCDTYQIYDGLEAGGRH